MQAFMCVCVCVCVCVLCVCCVPLRNRLPAFIICSTCFRLESSRTWWYGQGSTRCTRIKSWQGPISCHKSTKSCSCNWQHHPPTCKWKASRLVWWPRAISTWSEMLEYRLSKIENGLFDQQRLGLDVNFLPREVSLVLVVVVVVVVGSPERSWWRWWLFDCCFDWLLVFPFFDMQDCEQGRRESSMLFRFSQCMLSQTDNY